MKNKSFFFFSYSFGFLGNFFALIVFSSQNEFRQNSTGLLFILMIISNTIHLWTLSIDFLITYGIYLYVHVFFQCRLQLFLLNVTRAMSSYLAMSISLDRFLRSEMPIRSRMICIPKNVLKLTLSYLILFSFLLSFFFCPLNGQNPRTRACVTNQSPIYSSFIQNVFFPVRAFLTCVVPIFVMTLTNIRMLRNISQSRRRVNQRALMINTVSLNPLPTHLDLSQQTQIQSSNSRLTALDRALVLMTVANVTVFTVTQIPLHTYIVTRAFAPTLDAYTHTLVRAMLLIWSSLYFGIAFYLYCLTAPLFRQRSFQLAKQWISSLQRFIRLQP